MSTPGFEEFRIDAAPPVRPEPPQTEAARDTGEPPPRDTRERAPAEEPAPPAPTNGAVYKTKGLHLAKEKEEYEAENKRLEAAGKAPSTNLGPQMTWRTAAGKQDPLGTRRVKYISSEAERKGYELQIGANAQFVWGGRVFGLEQVRELKILAGAGAKGTTEDGAIFVMTQSGTIYMANQVKEVEGPLHFHHSSFLAGEPVAAAGSLKFKEEKGKIVLTEITDMSGHYRPTLAHTRQFLKELVKRGVDLTDVWFRGFAGASDKTPRSPISAQRVADNPDMGIADLWETGSEY